MLRYASAVCAVIMYPSVTSLQRVLQGWQNLGSHKQCHIIAQGTSFLMSKITAKFQRGPK